MSPVAGHRQRSPGSIPWSRGEFVVDTAADRIDVGLVHSYLSRSYWAAEIPRAVVREAVANSLCFGLYRGDEQIGFARVVTDRATFAWVCDVFVLEEWRGRGLGVWLMRCVADHPQLQGLRRWLLATRDAHGLYAKSGFAAPMRPESLMERLDSDVYRRPARHVDSTDDPEPANRRARRRKHA